MINIHIYSYIQLTKYQKTRPNTYHSSTLPQKLIHIKQLPIITSIPYFDIKYTKQQHTLKVRDGNTQETLILKIH